MLRPLAALFAVAAALAPWYSLQGQRSTTRTGTLAGLRFTLPARFTPVASLSDAATAVHADTARRGWAFVALLPDAGQRPAVIRRVAGSLAVAALGGGADGVEWQLGVAMPVDSTERFRERLMSLGGDRSLDVTFRQFRVGGRDVLVGSAEVLEKDDISIRICGSTSGFGDHATEWLISSLLGRPEPQVVMGFQELTPGSPPPPENPEERRVLNAFDAYTRAIRARDTAAAGLVTPGVLAFYDDIRTLALRATPAEVRRLTLLRRLLVLTLRHRVEPARLRAMAPADVFAALEVENGQFDPSITPGKPMMGMGPGLAWLQLGQGGRRTSMQVAFVRGGGRWRVDTLPMLVGTECIFRGQLRANGVTRGQEDALLIRTIESVTGRATSPGIWEPLEPGATGTR